jgi:hypothetical protein
MTGAVNVEIPISADVADLLKDAARRELIGRLVSRVLQSWQGQDPLAAEIRAAKQEARLSGLSDADIDAELAAYNAEHRA